MAKMQMFDEQIFQIVKWNNSIMANAVVDFDYFLLKKVSPFLNKVINIISLYHLRFILFNMLYTRI